MLLTDARRAARTGPDGELIPLAEQDRSAVGSRRDRRGRRAHHRARCREASVGAYQLQAAIAAVHDEAARAEDTDWPQILALYGLLERMSDNPMVTLNHAIAAAMVHGPPAGSRCSRRSTPTRAGRPPPPRRRARAPARDGRATRRPPSRTTAPPPRARRAFRSATT